jgi:hypothetical protein
MKQLLCLVVGHQKTLMAFSSNRFTCRRCGADLGRDVPTQPSSPPVVQTHPKPRAADPLRRVRREHPLADRLAASGMRRRHTRTVLTPLPDPPWSAGDVEARQAPLRYDADQGRDAAT